MPELPEVETVRRTLEQLIIGKEIKEVRVLWPNIVKHPEQVEVFQDALVGEVIEEMDRRGKFLMFHTTHYTLVSHLRMEGKYFLKSQDEIPNKHVHVLFAFTDGTVLWYQDVRKFGTMHLYKRGEALNYAPLNKLGPEPFSEVFTVDFLKEKLSKGNRKVKVALLDQNIVVGLGNIYVDEVLFRSRIHPEVTVNMLEDEDYPVLHEAIIETLGNAIEKGGSTIRSYVNSQGKIGEFQNELYVYSRKGQPCFNCGHEIEKTKVGGRGTHYCPQCQQKK
ncbi:MAG: DNA-formamidopyrimidine glycosylase [Bacillaceae bacterium]